MAPEPSKPALGKSTAFETLCPAVMSISPATPAPTLAVVIALPPAPPEPSKFEPAPPGEAALVATAPRPFCAELLADALPPLPPLL